MKKYISIIWIMVMTLLMVGCDDMIKEEPTSFYVEENFFTSAENAQLAVYGAYSVLNEASLYGQYMSCVYPYDNDLGQFATSFATNQMRETIAKYYITANNNNLEASWKNLYWGIQKANETIAAIRKMDLLENGSDEEKAAINRSLGEILFLRGWLYYDLVKSWGGVPLITEPVNMGDDFFLERASSEEVYTQIITDMKEAAQLVDWKSALETSERPTKGAIKGMLARVYLHAAGYTLQPDGTMKRPDNYQELVKEALVELDEIIASGEHSLNPVFRQVFYNYHQFKLDLNESMLEVPFFATDGASGGLIGQVIGVKQHVRSMYSKAIGKVNILQTYYNSFAENDTIRQNVCTAKYEIDKKSNFKPYPKARPYMWTCGKWRRHWIHQFNGGFSHNNVNCTNMNWVMLRYADVLLMYAEAYHACEKNGGLPSLTSGYSKFDALNEVRERVDLDEITEGNVSDKASSSQFYYGDSPDAFDVVVRDERAWELGFEGLRKYDLIRWNTLGASIEKTYERLKALDSKNPYMAGEEFEENKDELYAIPRRELIENPSLVPNPSNM
ncbi:RagB/SusD family nutrient uptake outer membrane protein [Puteibacter caeruleilacunae]|nr:RagB/SusD family nutrient uptake outer membrane protein [Puteibacter caeruleilacunae]